MCHRASGSSFCRSPDASKNRASSNIWTACNPLPAEGDFWLQATAVIATVTYAALAREVCSARATYASFTALDAASKFSSASRPSAVANVVLSNNASAASIVFGRSTTRATLCSDTLAVGAAYLVKQAVLVVAPTETVAVIADVGVEGRDIDRLYNG